MCGTGNALNSKFELRIGYLFYSAGSAWQATQQKHVGSDGTSLSDLNLGVLTVVKVAEIAQFALGVALVRGVELHLFCSTQAGRKEGFSTGFGEVEPCHSNWGPLSGLTRGLVAVVRAVGGVRGGGSRWGHIQS